MPKSMGEVSQYWSAKSLPHMHPAQVAVLSLCFAIGATIAVLRPQYYWAAIPVALVGIFIFASLQVAAQWEKAVVLRMGKFRGLRGPGSFMILPVIDNVTKWIDHRVITTSFSAEQTLTMDTVPVDVDAVLFWMVWDAEKAALEVQDYQQAVFWSAQTALRDIIGRTTLAEMLKGRQELDAELQKIIDEKTTPWGITVQSVEIRDVKIPTALQDAMSREAQAERERHARVILGAAEEQIAQSFVNAGKAYEDNPIALHLRAMNMLYESLKEKGAMIVVPSTAVQTMGLGTITGLSALATQSGQGVESQPPEEPLE
ncbi:MAG: slipin family protein [Armatimonadota bacterium]|nr:slipin family protein [Armatimonadota bacterium]